MRKRKYTKEYLQPLVSQAKSITHLIKLTENKPSGGMHSMLQNLVRLHDLDTSHFNGQAWSKGLTKETHPGIKKQSEKVAYTDEQILVKKSPISKTSRLRPIMIKNGISYICENGHSPEWMGKPLTLHIDHKNGIHNDNRLENLRFLCPNCHQQTDTWGNGAQGGT